MYWKYYQLLVDQNPNQTSIWSSPFSCHANSQCIGQQALQTWIVDQRIDWILTFWFTCGFLFPFDPDRHSSTFLSFWNPKKFWRFRSIRFSTKSLDMKIHTIDPLLSLNASHFVVNTDFHDNCDVRKRSHKTQRFFSLLVAFQRPRRCRTYLIFKMANKEDPKIHFVKYLP